VQALLIKVIAHVSILPRTRSSAGAPLILIFCTAKKVINRGGVAKTVDVTFELYHFVTTTLLR
jgi:hypothetical protein